jgi:hypothetical protein
MPDDRCFDPSERILELGSPPRVRLDRVNGAYHLAVDSRVMILPRETARRIAACILTDLERDRAFEED